eukprot:SAG31_NODE_2629_length_5350_cov_2.286612_3_plen_116_part_00
MVWPTSPCEIFAVTRVPVMCSIRSWMRPAYPCMCSIGRAVNPLISAGSAVDAAMLKPSIKAAYAAIQVPLQHSSASDVLPHVGLKAARLVRELLCHASDALLLCCTFITVRKAVP